MALPPQAGSERGQREHHHDGDKKPVSLREAAQLVLADAFVDFAQQHVLLGRAALRDLVVAGRR